MRKLLCTSTGFENLHFRSLFRQYVKQDPKKIKILYIPTACTRSPQYKKEYRAMTKACIDELVEMGMLRKNVTEYDLNYRMEYDELKNFDLLYFAGGDEHVLMKAINDIDFKKPLLKAIDNGIFFVGVSAGAMIVSSAVKNSLGIIPNHLEPHMNDDHNPDGPIPRGSGRINISDNQALWIYGNSKIIIS